MGMSEYTLDEMIEWALDRRSSHHLTDGRADAEKCRSEESKCRARCLIAQAVADYLRTYEQKAS
ncbi:MAG: hypothetical protein KTV68_13310 [Acidimicrobiia bacterium]|nr:hypothetical protein [Acidimicrobiia bacterium]MCY4435551.1 hypothetical protein [bacterium]